MERIHARALETENRVRMLETDGMRLSLYHTMLTNISTQATLLLGFALATFGADLLPYVLDDESSFCVYKSWLHMVTGFLFLTANTCCVCFCMLVVVFSSLLITRSQEAYLHVGGTVAVYRTQTVVRHVYQWYTAAITSFLSAAILLLWVFLGLPAWIETNDPLSAGDVVTRDGRKLVRCLDAEIDSEHTRRQDFGASPPARCLREAACPPPPIASTEPDHLELRPTALPWGVGALRVRAGGATERGARPQAFGPPRSTRSPSCSSLSTATSSTST